MALEQLAIVIGVVLGFWTGFFTRDRMYIRTRSYLNCIHFCVVISTRRYLLEIAAGHSASSGTHSCVRLSHSSAISAASYYSRQERRGAPGTRSIEASHI